MKHAYRLLLAGVLLGLPTLLLAQAPKIKFGEVEPAELQSKFYPADTSAEAVVLFDVGKTYYQISTTAGLQLFTERHTRIKILKKAGYDWATVRIPLIQLNNSDQERIENLRAYTYSLENGQVKKEKLEKESVFVDKKEDNWVEKRFTLPNVREGSVIEYSYVISSGFWWQLRDWTFQSAIPVAWSEYRLSIPDYFHFKLNTLGYERLAISEQGKQGSDYAYHFAAQSVPAVRPEAYITTLDDYLTRIEFDLAGVQIPGAMYRDFSQNWQSLNEGLLKSESFGGALRQRGFLKETARILAAEADSTQRAVAACTWVREQMKWNGVETKYVETSLKKAYEARTGNAADLNLMLVALLREAGAQANPVILSTRDHGRVLSWNANARKFNYVVAAARVGDRWLLFDATDRAGKPGALPRRCLNGTGWMVSEKGADFISLASTERMARNAVLTLALDTEGTFSGKADFAHQGYAAADVRRDLLTDGHEPFTATFRKERPTWDFEKLTVTNLDKPSEPLAMNCALTLRESVQVAGGRMYFKPLLTEGETANPFRQEQRKYPVDFGAPMNEAFVGMYTLPAGYAVEELPKSASFVLPDNAGRFTYSVRATGNQLQVSSRFSINKTLFLPDEYPDLKAFFDQIVAKHAEQVALKKE